MVVRILIVKNGCFEYSGVETWLISTSAYTNVKTTKIREAISVHHKKTCTYLRKQNKLIPLPEFSRMFFT